MWKHRALAADVFQVVGWTASVIPALRQSPDNAKPRNRQCNPSDRAWLLSFLNGSTIIELAFGHLYRWLPGSAGAIKGLIYGALGWATMGLVFFPMIGLGFFAFQVGLGISPALFSLGMLLTYSVTLGIVYGALNP
jgi:hypothetical protein